MALSFPSSPTVGQTSTQNGRLYTWSGYAWELTGNVAGHASTHGASGSDPVTIASSQVTGLATVATSGSAADLSAGTLPDARLSGNVITNSILSAVVSTSAVDTFDRRMAGSLATSPTGIVLMTFFTPFASATVTQMTAGNSVAGTAITLARFGLYTVDASGAATLVARTANDTTIFASTATTYTRSFSTAGGYPASYLLSAGSRYAAAFILVMTSGSPTIIASNTQFAAVSLSPRVGGRVDSQSDLPTSVASGGYSATAQTTYPWFRLS